MAMRSCEPFDVPVPADLKGAIERLQTMAQSQGGEFAGDETAGRFVAPSPLGPIEGRYTIQGAAIRVTVTNKPMLVPCATIEERIRKYFV
jgi:hypothetical protein